MRQRSDTVRSMIRPTFSPTSNQLAATREAKRLAAQLKRLTAQVEEVEAKMWLAIKNARDAGVPDVLLCDETGQSRATLNRKFGARTEPPHGA